MYTQVDHNSNSDLFQMVVTFREEKEKNEKMIQQNTQLRNQVPKIEKRDIESENRHSDDITLFFSLV